MAQTLKEREPATLCGGSFASDRVAEVRYELLRIIGRGASSDVYFALRHTVDQAGCVAIKVLRDGHLPHDDGVHFAFEKEIHALATLHRDPRLARHVVRLIDYGTWALAEDASPDHPLRWVALEYVAGGSAGATLAERVRHSVRCSGHAFDAARAARAISCIAGALEAVHDAGIVHRDVKPSNVLCRGELGGESWLLADFGICRPPDVAATFGGLAVGSPGYAPPEQAAVAMGRIGPFSDVFGFAAVIYFVLTGESYFPARAPDDVMTAIRSGKRRALDEADGLVPELRAHPARHAIDAALAQATSSRPELRPQRAGELAAALLNALQPVHQSSADES